MAANLSFLFDEHVHHRAYVELRRRGVDVRHVGEEGLGGRDDLDLLRLAAEQGRIVVTRNYQDFAPLLQAFMADDRSSPGVLFLSPSIPDRDVGAHVRAIEGWIASVEGQGSAGESPIENTYGWLEPA